MIRLRGRYTLYGEFLMHERTWGYIAPAPMELTVGGPPHATYVSGLDESAALLRRMGLSVQERIGGDLPFGLGFASSTTLAILHLGDQVDEPERAEIVKMIDWAHHGFRPSGVDYRAISSQAPILYRSGDWAPVLSTAPQVVFARTEPGPPRPIKATIDAVHRVADTLAVLADSMTESVRAGMSLDDRTLSEYAECLESIDVYSESQRRLIRAAFRHGVIAKGIGGLYNKAVMLVGDPSQVEHLLSEQPARRLGGEGTAS